MGLPRQLDRHALAVCLARRRRATRAHISNRSRNPSIRERWHRARGRVALDQTPPFAQLASQLFASGSGDQKMAMINALPSSVSASEQRAQLSALIPGLGAAASVTNADAAAVSPCCPSDALHSTPNNTTPASSTR